MEICRCQSGKGSVQRIHSRLGIDLEVKIVPEQSFDKINVAMATGDLPDVVTINYPSYSVNQWISEGLLVPLNDYLPSMPAVKQRLDELAWTAVDGKFYGYPFIETERSNSALAYRADWLERLGLTPPSTLDEFYEVLKAFKTQDPDQNGQHDTYGFTTSKPGTTSFDFIFYAYGMPYGDWALDENNQVIPRFEHPSFQEGMAFIKKLWDEQLIEPEFMLNDIQMKEQKFYQSKVGMMDAALFRHVNRIESSLQKVVPEGKLGYMGPPAGADGNAGMKAMPKSGLFTAVTTNAKNPEKAALFIEFCRKKAESCWSWGLKAFTLQEKATRLFTTKKKERRTALLRTAGRIRLPGAASCGRLPTIICPKRSRRQSVRENRLKLLRSTSCPIW